MDNNVILSDYYQKNLSELRGFAMRIVKDDFIAQDIVQDTFVRLLNMKEIIIEGTLPALIYKTLQNLCLDHVRRTTYRVEAFRHIASCRSTWHDMESEVYAHDIYDKLDKGISTMSKRYQTIYRMNIFEGKQVSDITKALGISYKAAENCLGRARAEMRSFMRMCMSLVLMLTLSIPSVAADKFVGFNGGDLHLNANGKVNIAVDDKDHEGVRIAARSLAMDITNVTGCNATLDNSNAVIIAGTIGKSAVIDKILKQNKLTDQLKGKTEKFIITVVSDGKSLPQGGVGGGLLLIAGSDYRGTIYGLYELSRQIGVSPWYWWADVPVAKHKDIYINKGVYTDGEPAVRYRGLFLNDEAPCLTSWVENTFKTKNGGHEFYAKVFELILRLRGNMLWPAMWGWAFYADDPLNQKTANDMGVIIGTSHHEPMARNHQEWARHRNEYGAWNYNTNKEVIKKFFREGIERMKGTDDIVTIGMRGDGDEAMSEEADTRLLEQIVADQRKIIEEVTGKKAKETPQVWALYKEVMDYYDKGMRVPDDVIMLLCDDNWVTCAVCPQPRNASTRADGDCIITLTTWEHRATASGLTPLPLRTCGSSSPLPHNTASTAFGFSTWATSSLWNIPSPCLWTWHGIRWNTMQPPSPSTPRRSAASSSGAVRQRKLPASSTSAASTMAAALPKCSTQRYIVPKTASGLRWLHSMTPSKPTSCASSSP